MSTTKWVLDPTHSELTFRVKHLMISTVSGHFNRFTATAETQGDDFSTAKIYFSADADSISTNNEQRDAHLKNPDFFDADNHPQINFESDRIERINEEEYKVYGTLTMKGKSNPVTLLVEHGGTTVDPWGNTRVGFSVSGKVNRNDYGVSFGMVSETGGLLLGDEIKINANVQFVMQKELEPA